MDALILDRRYRDAWNTFVAESPYGHVLQSWEWGDLKGLSGWQPVRLALRGDHRWHGCAQILIRHLPLGVGRLAYVPKGPVLDYGRSEAIDEMIRALRGFAADRRVISLKIEPEVTVPASLAAHLAGLELATASPIQMRSTIWVDLTASEDDLLARQKQKTRYNIRLAARKGVEVRAGTVDDLAPWYRMYHATARRDGFAIHSEKYYRDVLSLLLPRRMAHLLLAYHEGDLLAGIIVFRFGHKAQYMYGASSNEKRNLMAPYLVQWEGMRWAKEEGATIYDLWGIPDVLSEDEDLWGVYRHKKGYGGEIVRYVGAFDLVRSPIQHMALERLARPLFRQMTRLGR